jgi:hypothetical protein
MRDCCEAVVLLVVPPLTGPDGFGAAEFWRCAR